MRGGLLTGAASAIRITGAMAADGRWGATAGSNCATMWAPGQILCPQKKAREKSKGRNRRKITSAHKSLTCGATRAMTSNHHAGPQVTRSGLEKNLAPEMRFVLSVFQNKSSKLGALTTIARLVMITTSRGLGDESDKIRKGKRRRDIKTV